ncbi:MAG TPA: hypothetical protein VKB62_02525 [Streptosporangiaceae bacterium]|nr:hypothetical protein [Streptosporangiaceae bacterium]
MSQGQQIGPSPSARFPASVLDVRRRVPVRLRLSVRWQLSVPP